MLPDLVSTRVYRFLRPTIAGRSARRGVHAGGRGRRPPARAAFLTRVRLIDPIGHHWSQDSENDWGL